MPSVPPAQMAPAMSGMLYLTRISAGMASRPIETSVAPTTPAVAAKIVQAMMTAMPSPPRMRPMTMCMVSKSRSAMPEASRSCAMKMNSGTATSTYSSMTP